MHNRNIPAISLTCVKRNFPSGKLRSRSALAIFAVLFAFVVLSVQPVMTYGQDTTEVKQKITDACKRVFGENVVIEIHQILLDDSALARIKGLAQVHYAKTVGLYAAKVNGKVAGYGIVDNVRGKERNITYMLIVGTDLKVKDLEVLFYREQYGGEVESETWRNQFKGKSASDNVRVGGNIENISGATISTNNITYGVKKLLYVFQVLQERKLL